MSLVSFPSPSIGLLAGPLSTIGTTDYDLMQLEQAAIWDTSESLDLRNFYDGALVYYLLYYRTGDPQWATRADFLAVANADLQVDPASITAEGWSNWAPRTYSTLGMAIHYLRTGYANSLTAVRLQAKGGSVTFSPFTVPTSKDARESAYSLIAMVATTLLGGDPNVYTTNMAAALNAYFDRQGVDDTGGNQPNDAWQAWATNVGPDDRYIFNFMQGLVMEALILYDRVIGDARIVPCLKRAVDWIWTTQWVPLGGGPGGPDGTSATSTTVGTGSKVFTTQAGLPLAPGQRVQVHRTSTAQVHMAGTVTSYSGTTLTVNVTSIKGSGTFTDWTVQLSAYPGDQTATGIGTMQYGNHIGGDSHLQSNDNYSNLMGIVLPAFGYCYLKGQGVSYKTNGNAVLAGMGQATWFSVKEFNEGFRSSPRYLGYVETADTEVRTTRYTAAVAGGTV